MTNNSRSAPARLCCGQPHVGPRCPDGKVMCQLCFGRFDVDDLNVVSIDFEGQHENVCAACAAAERQGGPMTEPSIEALDEAENGHPEELLEEDFG